MDKLVVVEAPVLVERGVEAMVRAGGGVEEDNDAENVDVG